MRLKEGPTIVLVRYKDKNVPPAQTLTDEASAGHETAVPLVDHCLTPAAGPGIKALISHPVSTVLAVPKPHTPTSVTPSHEVAPAAALRKPHACPSRPQRHGVALEV